MSEYEPGEPYEFYEAFMDGWPIVLRYRCFRGNCGGTAVQVADRNTHNAYHNKREAGA